MSLEAKISCRHQEIYKRAAVWTAIEKMSKAGHSHCSNLPAKKPKETVFPCQQWPWQPFLELCLYGHSCLPTPLQPAVKYCPLLNQFAAAKWWRKGAESGALCPPWKFHVTLFCHYDAGKGSSPIYYKGYDVERGQLGQVLQINLVEKALKKHQHQWLCLTPTKWRGLITMKKMFTMNAVLFFKGQEVDTAMERAPGKCLFKPSMK